MGPCGSSGGPWPIRKTDPTTGATTTLGSTLTSVRTITIGTDNNLYVTAYDFTFGNSSVYSINKTTGAETRVAALSGVATAMTADSAGLYVSMNSSTLLVTYAGTVSTITSSFAGSWLESAGSYLYATAGPDNNRVWRIAKSDGTLVPVAGSGTSGYQDGTGTDAWFNGIAGIGTDGTNVFVADSANLRIRKIVPGSALPSSFSSAPNSTVNIGPAQVSTVADTSVGLGGSVVSNGGLFVTAVGAIKRVDLASGAVTTVTGSGTASPGWTCTNSATPSLVTFPDTGPIASDGYYLYTVSQCGGGISTWQVRRTSIATGATSLVTTNGVTSSGFQPSMVFGPDGFLYVVQGNTVRRIDPISGNEWDIVSGIPVLALTSVTADSAALYMVGNSSTNNDRYLMKVTLSSLALTTMVTYPASDTWKPYRLAVAGAYIYATDQVYLPGCTCSAIYRLKKSTPASKTLIAGGVTGGYQDGVGVSAYFNGVSSLATDGKNIYAADSGNHLIRLLVPGQYPKGDALPNPGGCPCQQRPIGPPVEAGSGNFYHSFADIGIPGRAGGIGVSRTYSASVAGQDGMFGWGWSSPYSMRIDPGPYTTTTGPTMRVTQENSTVAQFGWNGSAWVAPTDLFATLVHNGDGSWTFTRRARERFVFNSLGYLTQMISANGFAGSPSPAVAAAYTTTLFYGFGLLVSVTDPAGRSLTFTYNTNLKISDVTDPTTRHVHYDYNPAGELTDVTDVAGGNWHFTYDPGGQHLMLTMRDPRVKTIVANVYDDSGRVTSQTDALGRVTSFDYTSIANSVLVTEPGNNLVGANKTLYTYSNGTLVSETHGYGSAAPSTWSFTYDTTTGTPLTVTDPRGHVTTTNYDGNGNRTKQIVDTGDATHLNLTTNWAYDALNDLLTVQDPKSVTTTYTYDTAGNLTSSSTPWVEQPGTNQVAIFWHGDAAHPGDVTNVTDPSGRTSNASYDASTGDLLSSTTPAGDKTTHTYDSLGRRLTMVSPKGNASGGTPSNFTTKFTVNAFGDVLTVKDPLDASDPNNHTTTTTYDPDRNARTVKDAKNQTTTYNYDDESQLISEDRPDTPQTHLLTDYWPDGSLKSQTDGAGKITSYNYDEQGRLTSMIDPNSRTTAYGYDPGGNQTSVTNPSGQATVIVYDAADRRVAMVYSDGVTPGVLIGYDNDSQRTVMADGTGVQSWTWDSLHRLSSQTDGAGQTVGYGYDLAGRKTSITYPGTGKVVTLTPDTSGRLHTVADWMTPTNTNTFDYDPNSNQTTATFANGVIGTNTYDNADRLMGIQTKKGASTLANWVYTRDNANLLSGVTSTGVGPTETYTHNPLNQLGTQGASSYTYDSADNLTKLANGTRQVFDSANQLCWTSPTTSSACGSPPADATTYGYDARGNQQSKTTNSTPVQSSNLYDQSDRLASASGPYLPTKPLGLFNAVTPVRVLDTRSGSPIGTCYQPNTTMLTNCATPAMTANTTRFVQVSGVNGVPASGVTAVAVNVTEFAPAAAGIVTVFASNATSTTRDLTYANGVTNSNAVVVQLGPDGRLGIKASAGVPGIAVEVLGYYYKSTFIPTIPPSPVGTPPVPTGGVYTPVTPTQIATGTVTASNSVNIPVTGTGGVPAATVAGGVSGAVLQLNVTGTTAAGFAQVWDTGSTRPNARSLSFLNADNATEMIVTKLSASGQASLFASGSNITYTVKVIGYYTASPLTPGTFTVSQTPTRVLKTTATVIGTCTPSPCAQLAANSQKSVQVTGQAGVPSTGVKAVIVVATNQNATAAGNLALSNTAGTPSPVVTFANGEAQSNTTVVPVDADGKVVFRNNSTGVLDVFLDVIGWQNSGATTYSYDGDGLRTKKTAPDGTVTTFLWDHSSGLPLLLGEKTGTNQTFWINGPGGLPVEEIRPDNVTVRYYQHDQIGSTRLITDPTGANIGTANYDPYGKVSSTTGVTTPLGFSGQYTDTETGYQYLRARYYDPNTGQFLTRDPLVAETRSAYGYVAGNPLNSIDPTGLAEHWSEEWMNKTHGELVAEFAGNCDELRDAMFLLISELSSRDLDLRRNKKGFELHDTDHNGHLYYYRSVQSLLQRLIELHEELCEWNYSEERKDWEAWVHQKPAPLGHPGKTLKEYEESKNETSWWEDFARHTVLS